MKTAILAAALSGIVAGVSGCPSTSRPTSVPGAPGMDPEGATHTSAQGEAKTGEKHACNAEMGCNGMKDAKAPDAAAAPAKPTPTPNP